MFITEVEDFWRFKPSQTNWFHFLAHCIKLRCSKLDLTLTIRWSYEVQTRVCALAAGNHQVNGSFW
jgi:hypothetical protein